MIYVNENMHVLIRIKMVFRKGMDLYDLETIVHLRRKLFLRIVDMILSFKDFEK